jgi:protein-tyrosine-phosphatase
MEPGQYKLLFVCTGNACRSPMAEYLLRDRLGPDSAWTVESAGTAAADGLPATPEAVRVLAEAQIDLSPHRSRRLTADLVEQADIVVVMTRMHQAEVLMRFPGARDKTFLFASFGTEPEIRDIPDPIGQSTFVYRMTRNVLDSGMADLILHMKDYEKQAAEEAGQ